MSASSPNLQSSHLRTLHHQKICIRLQNLFEALSFASITSSNFLPCIFLHSFSPAQSSHLSNRNRTIFCKTVHSARQLHFHGRHWSIAMMWQMQQLSESLPSNASSAKLKRQLHKHAREIHARTIAARITTVAFVIACVLFHNHRVSRRE